MRFGRIRKNTWKRASFTVEAAAVMPLVLLALVVAVMLCLHVHHQSWLVNAAEEAALCGSMAGISEDGKVYENAKMRCKERERYGFPGTSKVSGEVAVGDRVTVVYEATTGKGLYGILWKLHAQADRKILMPTKTVREQACKRFSVGGGAK